jgi:hypothetical protein
MPPSAASQKGRPAASSTSAAKAPTIIMSPWAKLVILRMPNTMERPMATSA